VKQIADRLHDELAQQGIDVLLDDRDERPGPKFKDADMIGIPLRLTVGDKGLAQDQIEFKPRTAEKPDMIAVDDAVDRVKRFLSESA